jgi:hypothetical protein
MQPDAHTHRFIAGAADAANRWIHRANIAYHTWLEQQQQQQQGQQQEQQQEQQEQEQEQGQQLTVQGEPIATAAATGSGIASAEASAEQEAAEGEAHAVHAVKAAVTATGGGSLALQQAQQGSGAAQEESGGKGNDNNDDDEVPEFAATAIMYDGVLVHWNLLGLAAVSLATEDVPAEVADGSAGPAGTAEWLRQVSKGPSISCSGGAARKGGWVGPGEYRWRTTQLAC